MTSLPTIRKRRKRWNLFFLALPLMLMVLAFRYAPLFGWYLSLVDYKVGQPIFKSRFVGLYFFKMLFTSRDMSRIMRNSIILSALKTVSLVLPPVFAILLNELNNSRFPQVCTDDHNPAALCQLGHCVFYCLCAVYFRWYR